MMTRFEELQVGEQEILSDRNVTKKKERSSKREFSERVKSILSFCYLPYDFILAENVDYIESSLFDDTHRPTFEHSCRVGKMLKQMAHILGRDPSLWRMIGVLHDIGKINISTEILYKSECLTDEEYMKVKYHPADGALILEQLNAPREVFLPIHQHHERLDGSGYHGLMGNQICELARAITIVDSWDAITSNGKERAYSQASSEEYAASELRNANHYDQSLVELFLKKVDKVSCDACHNSSGLC